MGQTINSTTPDKPTNGASLTKDSVAGRKAQFIRDTNTGSSGGLTISIGGTFTVSFNLDLWPETVPESAQDANNIIAPDDCIAWAFEDIYIDADTPTNYYGSSNLTSAQHKVVYTVTRELNPEVYSGSTPHSATTLYKFTNNDSSTHVIYFYGNYKYIIFGDSNL